MNFGLVAGFSVGNRLWRIGAVPQLNDHRVEQGHISLCINEPLIYFTHLEVYASEGLGEVSKFVTTTLRIAVTLGLVAASILTSACSKVDCSKWNTPEFFSDTTSQKVKDCLDAGADANAIDDDGHTPLQWAARMSEDVNVTEALLDEGANANATDKVGNTPLHIAVGMNENVEVTKTLLVTGANVNATNDAGYTPLHVAFINSKYPEVVLTLLEAGANANAVGYKGITPLHQAAKFNENSEKWLEFCWTPERTLMRRRLKV